MDEFKIQNQSYEARLHWNITNTCNLHCVYCFSRARLKTTSRKIKLSLKEIVRDLFRILKERIVPINISSLIDSLERTNRVFQVSFTGGEPFLIPNLIDACVAITKKHYISFITNLTSTKIQEFAERINPQRVIKILASLHIKELKRLNLLNRYMQNFKICQQKLFNIEARIPAYPALLSEAGKYKKYFSKNGIDITFAPFKGYYKEKKYPSSYTPEELKVFGLNDFNFKKFETKGKICNAGYNILLVKQTGVINPCYQINQELGNIYEKIKFNDYLITCPHDFCGCPFFTFDANVLFTKALKDFHKDPPKNQESNLR